MFSLLWPHSLNFSKKYNDYFRALPRHLAIKWSVLLVTGWGGQYLHSGTIYSHRPTIQHFSVFPPLILKMNLKCFGKEMKRGVQVNGRTLQFSSPCAASLYEPCRAPLFISSVWCTGVVRRNMSDVAGSYHVSMGRGEGASTAAGSLLIDVLLMNITSQPSPYSPPPAGECRWAEACSRQSVRDSWFHLTLCMFPFLTPPLPILHTHLQYTLNHTHTHTTTHTLKSWNMLCLSQSDVST